MKPEHGIERKVWLLKNPGVIARISRAVGRSESLIYQVLRGEKRSARIAAALAAAGAPGFSQESSHGKYQQKRSSKKTAPRATR